MTLGWVVDHSEALPLIDGVLFAPYHQAMMALSVLDQRQPLAVGSAGFDQVAGIVRGMIEPTDATIAKIEEVNAAAGLALGRTSSRNFVRRKLRITLATGGTGDVDLEDLEQALTREYRDQRRSCVGNGTFWLGAALQVALAFV